MMSWNIHKQLEVMSNVMVLTVKILNIYVYAYTYRICWETKKKYLYSQEFKKKYTSLKSNAKFINRLVCVCSNEVRCTEYRHDGFSMNYSWSEMNERSCIYT